MPVFNPEYERKIAAVTWTTNASATTAVDDTTTFGSTYKGLLHSMLIVGHSWDVVGGGASGCSGAQVDIIDDAGNVILESPEVLTGSTTLMSGDVMMVGAHTVRYRMCDGNINARVISGAGTPWSQWNDPKVYMYMY